MNEHEKYEACRQAMAADETEARAAAERTERENKAAVALVAALEVEDGNVIQQILDNGGVTRDRYEVARRAMEEDEVAARAAAEKAEREKKEAAASAAEMEASEGVWDSVKELGKREKSGTETLIEAVAMGAIASKTIFGEPEPSPSVEQLEALRKREEDEQRRREEYQKYLQSLPLHERILHERINKLESEVASQNSEMREMRDAYERKISDLESDMSDLEE